jgi:uncharacterized protein YecE (DUF72 family)
MIRVGTAGWAIPRAVAEAFPTEGTGLQRYGARLNCAEINTTFYRSHRPGTLARWAGATPADFLFAVKAPKAVTHERRLIDCDDLVDRFLGEIRELGGKLGPVLMQLPPKLAFEAVAAGVVFNRLRTQFDGDIVCEPRHASWFGAEAEALLTSCRIARVAADPACVPAAAVPGGWPGLVYLRLHGSPQMYRSTYDDAALARIAQVLRAAHGGAWCIFDNTASGAAATDAMRLRGLLERPAPDVQVSP